MIYMRNWISCWGGNVARMSLSLAFLLLYIIGTRAQETKKIVGSYKYYSPENISLEEAKHIAVNRAKVGAISQAFGTLISQSNATIISNSNRKSDNRFFSLGGSEVKGEWIETTKEPVFDIKYQQGMLVIGVKLEGVVRKIGNEQVNISAKILRNGTTSKYESDNFRNGDDMYLLFSAPTDGYLIAYMYDELSQSAVCLLPYINNTVGYQRIKGGKEYLFFKQDVNEEHADEYTLTTTGETPEFDTLYLLFSREPIYMAGSDISVNDSGMRSISCNDFIKWLTTTRKNPLVNVIEKTITIKYNRK